MKLNRNTLQSIKEYIISVYPNEMCGFLLKNETFIPCENLAENPTKSFKLNYVKYIQHKKNLSAILHSHSAKEHKNHLIDIRTPSYVDLINQKKTNLPWGIFGSDGETVTDPIFFPRTPNKNYLKRKFFWHINDCRTLIQDYFLFEFNIEIATNYNYVDLREVEKNPSHLKNIFDEVIINENLIPVTKITELQKGDIFFMKAMQPFGPLTHLGVWTGKKILHQELISKESTYTEIAGRINAIYRHPLLEKNL
jgi:proteasome lid subunit RPN8/RPN11